MVYYNDILFSIIVLIYQIGGIKDISFYNMNFHLSIKNIRKGFLFLNEDNNYKLIDEEFQYNIDELNI